MYKIKNIKPTKPYEEMKNTGTTRNRYEKQKNLSAQRANEVIQFEPLSQKTVTH